MIGNCEDIKEKSGDIYLAITNYVFFPTGDEKYVILYLAAQQLDVLWSSFNW